MNRIGVTPPAKRFRPFGPAWPSGFPCNGATVSQIWAWFKTVRLRVTVPPGLFNIVVVVVVDVSVTTGDGVAYDHDYDDDYDDVEEPRLSPDFEPCLTQVTRSG